MRFILAVFTVLVSFGLHSQKTFTISFTTENIKKVKKNYTKEFKDSISAIRYIKEIQTFAVKKGYLLTSVDSISVKNKTISAAFFVGEKFNSVQLELVAVLSRGTLLLLLTSLKFTAGLQMLMEVLRKGQAALLRSTVTVFSFLEKRSR